MNLKESKGIFARTLTFIGTTILACSTAIAAIEIDQQPLLVAKPVPGNMAILGSFEFPTMVTRAYKGNYSTNAEFVGYFDSEKCYQYNYDDDERKRHFYPVNKNGPICSGDDQWSGHFLNWASMQSIDIFRHILTGGRRFYDVAGETWLEKGFQTGQGSAGNNFPDNNLSNSTVISHATPTDWQQFKTRIGQANQAMGNKLRFTHSGDLSRSTTTPYNPKEHTISKNNKKFDGKIVYEVSIRVKVCTPTMPEDNCKKYSENNYKPEGLIQQHADSMRYSAFGYLNDNSGSQTFGTNRNRKGGIMHARMKYVGPTRITSNNTEETNPNREWHETNGVMENNPDSNDAQDTDFGDTPVTHSGVINYINNSGHLVPGTKFKQYDNVSELYYTAYRYLKGLNNIAAYTNVSDKTGADRDRLVGGLPIISDWKKDGHDPIQFSCQKNFFLGIGDTNTHNDRGFVTDGSDDPLFAGSPSKFKDLRGVIHAREGMTDTSVSGSVQGSDHIAVLAYDANTSDLRPDMPGEQRASTYWIDILESGLKAPKNNPYWLAAKYGGLKTPEDFDPTSKTAKIENSWWWSTGDKLSNDNPRPDNFYVVSSAQDMINSLTQAFADIQREQRGNRSSLALNSTQLESGSMIFQVQYVSGSWTGNMYAYTINPNSGELISEPAWNAESKLPKWDEREVYVNNNGLKLFRTEGKNLTGFDADLAQYLLGKRDKESDGSFRVRQGVLGDIVNSQPVYVGLPNPRLFSNRSFTGSSSYSSWANSITREPTVYVGGNDGMLHGFNALTGEETFAFIPATVVANGLSELADKNYEHRYFVDGEITVADTYINGSWRTVLVGTLGAGGLAKNRKDTNNAIFALDITDPNSVSLLWEKSSADIPALGINLGKPVIIQDQSSNWKVVLGNGPNSASGKSHLISINLADGAVSAPQLSNAANNGLSAIRAWDQDGDGRTDTLYAGDLQGALWKITNLTATNPTVAKLFTATDPSGAPQPITSTPLAGKSPYDRTTWLFFGTGLYLSTTDLSNKQVQSWYGIKDDGTAGHVRNDLLERKIIQEVTVSARVIEEGAREDLANKKGWHIDLYRVQKGSKQALGERMITPNQFQGSALISNTRIPDASDPCAPSGVGMVMSINPFTGARLSDTYFDVNNDQNFNQSDLVVIDGVPTVVSGIGFDTGFSNPSFLGDKMYVPTDEGTIKEVGVKPYASIVGRTSWRELINTGD